MTNVEDVYPLSPMQEGMLFHTLLEPRSGAFVVQVTSRIDGELDIAAFKRCWQTLLERHPILRSAFLWERVEKPLQVVRERLHLEWDEPDWSALCSEDQEEHLRKLLERNSCRGFDLAQAPLMRMTIARLGGSRYEFVWCYSHLLLDGWSVNLLWDEMFVYYRAYTRGESPDLRRPRPYRDFIAWMQKQDKSHAEAFWRRTLLGFREPTLIEMEYLSSAREHVGADGYLELSSRLSEPLTDQLKLAARHSRITLSTFAQGAWALLLSCYSRQNDVVFGVTVSGRPVSLPGAESLVGLLVNTLPVRVSIESEKSMVAWLRGIQERNLEIREYEYSSLAEIKQWSEVPASARLFESSVVFENQPVATGVQEAEGNLRFLSSRIMEVVPYPLTLFVEPGNDLRLRIIFDTKRFGSGNVRKMFEHLQIILEQMGANVERQLRDFTLLSEGDREKVLVEWNGTPMEYPGQTCIHELFEKQVERTPEATAVEYEGTTLNYRDLNRLANQLAHDLRKEGVGPETLVGFCVERSLEMVVGILGILKAGGAYVPLDPNYPRERLEYILRDSGPALVVTQRSVENRLPASGFRKLRLDGDDGKSGDAGDSGQLRKRAEENLSRAEVGVRPDHLAYAIYTSGSTGKPKGVMGLHRGMVNRCAWMWKQYPFMGGEVCCHKTSLSFVDSIAELFVPLLAGVPVVVASDDLVKDVRRLARLVEEKRVTRIVAVPSMLEAMLECEEDLGERLRLVKYWVSSGEKLMKRTVEEFKWCMGRSARLLNLYGSSEVSADATWMEIWEPEVERKRTEGNEVNRGGGSSVAIGRPMANTRIYLLNDDGQPLPVGAVGELYVGGEGIARGYLNRPELTAERFLPDPYNAGGSRMYRTGDLGRWLENGTIEFIGRNDHQVKVRGYRIELEEIEAALLAIEGIEQAVVSVREDEAGQRRLVAYYTEKEQGKLSAESLRRHVTAALPDYMIPAAYVRMERLPLTPNGKLDRKSLPAPEGDAYARRGYEAPVGEMEVVIARIWSEVLKVERVGREDNFFELGGHSLLAVTLMDRMQRIGLRGDIRTLFMNPTLAGFAAGLSLRGDKVKRIEVPANRIPSGCQAITPEMLPLVELSAEQIEGIVSTVAGGAKNVQDIYPLAPLQEGILFHHLMSGEGDPYVLAAQLSFDSRERVNSYVKAMQGVIDRHDILRTGVVWDGLPEPVQVVWRKAALSVEEVILDPEAGDVSEQLAARFNPRHYRIDVRRAPLLRVFIAFDARQERWLMIQMLHHLAGDQGTLVMMQKEMQAFLLGEADRLPAALPFRNAVAQARLGVRREEHEAYFRQLLGDVEEPTAPFGLVDAREDGSEIQETSLNVGRNLRRGIQERARKLGVSAASLFHVAWARVLGYVSRREDVVFGTVLYGRMQTGGESERVMGLFINTLPVRIGTGGKGAERCVREAHQQLVQLIQHEHASLALAQRCSEVPAPAPLFSALLNYRHSVAAGTTERGRAWEGVRWLVGQNRTNYPMMLSVDDFGTEFRLTALVQPPIEPNRICEYVHRALESLVAALEREPGRAMRTLEVLPERERREILYEWNQTGVEYPQRCVHELFAEQVARDPEAVAVEYEDASFKNSSLQFLPSHN